MRKSTLKKLTPTEESFINNHIRRAEMKAMKAENDLEYDRIFHAEMDRMIIKAKMRVPVCHSCGRF